MNALCPFHFTSDGDDEMSESDEDQEGKLKASSAGAIAVPLGWPKVTMKVQPFLCQ